jgi:hypothetical protein
MEAVREALPDAGILSVDPFFYGHVDRHLPFASVGDPVGRELLRDAASYPASLAYGRVTADRPLARFLRDHGVVELELAWFPQRAQKLDVLGTNCYPRMRMQPAQGKPAPSTERAAQEASRIVKEAIVDAQSYFELPVYLTETSYGESDEAKTAHIHALHAMVQDLRWEGVPIVGVNWWPLFETIQWDYREEPEKPLVDFIYPGRGITVSTRSARVPAASWSGFRRGRSRRTARRSAGMNQ